MLDVHFVIVGAVIGVVGGLGYVRDTLRGDTQPNRVTWSMWAALSLLAFAVEVQVGVGLRSLTTLVAGAFPVLVVVVSFRNPRASWRIKPLDWVCGAMALVGLAVWLVTRHGSVALWASIAADALAAVPTLVKSWRWPQTETASAYLAAMVSTGITLLTVHRVTLAVVGFPACILVLASVEWALVAGRLGPRLRAWLGIGEPSRGDGSLTAHST